MALPFGTVYAQEDPTNVNGQEYKTQEVRVSTSDKQECEAYAKDQKENREIMEAKASEESSLEREISGIKTSNAYARIQRRIDQDRNLTKNQQSDYDGWQQQIAVLQDQKISVSVAKVTARVAADMAGEKYLEAQCLAKGDLLSPVNDPVVMTKYPGRIFDGEGLVAGSEQVQGTLKGVSTSRDLPRMIIGWVKFGLEFLAVVAVIAIVYAGVLMVTDFGDGSRKEQGQKIITYVVIGLIIIMSAYAIVNTVLVQQLNN